MSTKNHFLKQKYLKYKFVKCFENIDVYCIFISSQLLYSVEKLISVFKKQFGLV